VSAETISRDAFVAAVSFDANGLVPAIAQDARSGDVLMMAWMNSESFSATLETGDVF
jgi:phosphoribosyl-AMP cyclohydrolase